MPGSTRVPREALVGDPFLGVIAHALGGAGKLVGRAAGKAIKAIRKNPAEARALALDTYYPPTVGRAGSGTGHRALPPMAPAPGSAVVARGRLIPPPGARIQRFPAAVYATGRRRRRMNSLNLRALKRALRRVKSFEKIARKVIRPSARQHHFRRTFPARRKR